MPSPWMLLLRPAPGRPRADPVPTPPLPPPSFTAGTGPGNRGAFRANLYILGEKILTIVLRNLPAYTLDEHRIFRKPGHVRLLYQGNSPRLILL